jgi:hypothetical protein
MTNKSVLPDGEMKISHLFCTLVLLNNSAIEEVAKFVSVQSPAVQVRLIERLSSLTSSIADKMNPANMDETATFVGKDDEGFATYKNVRLHP